jgi:tetratricopeptide (TPR) repeat protein
MANVFLSYDREDAGQAQALAAVLEEAGCSVWWDRQIKAGSQYAKEIERAIAKADAVVVLWSKRSVESPWVRDEAVAGRDSGRLVPVTIDKIEPPLGFRQYQAIDLAGRGGRRRASQLQALVDAVSSITGTDGDEKALARRTIGRAAGTRRRELIIGGAAASLAAYGVGWSWFREDRLTGEPRILVEEAREILNGNEVDQLSGAVSRLRRATELAPDSAEVWGLLALAYQRQLHLAPKGERASLAARSEAAAKRSLTLDADQPDARAATIAAMPRFRNWVAYERAARDALKSHPNHPDLQMALNLLLQDVGRYREALPLLEAAMKHLSGAPQLHSQRILILTTLGRFDEAESALECAYALWPRHYSIWFTRIYFLQYNGRAGEAVAMVEDVANRPIGIPDWNFDLSALAAKALASHNPDMIRQALRALEQAAHRGTGFAGNAANFAAAVGDLDMAFRMLEALYFDRGFAMPDAMFAKEQGRYTGSERRTANLFPPEFARLRRDPRFRTLTRELGLEDYWRRTGTRNQVVA